MSYAEFISRKLSTVPATGIVGAFDLPDSLFPHQSALTKWAAKRGRAAIFADTGLGKMRMELVWADLVRKYTSMPVMIHTPLAVAQQLAAEGRKIGIETTVCREQSDVTDGINIINYDRLHKIDTSVFGGVVLDESGCIKHSSSRTFQMLTDAYRTTPFKLPATATPAPNDWTELGTHAEFLGICTKAEMLAEFFCHDGAETQVWRLKGHARALFWKWVATWGAMVRKPSDLGFADDGYILPPLNVHEHSIDFEMPTNGQLFASEAQTLSDRRLARKLSKTMRVDACASTVFDFWAKLSARTLEEVHHGLEERVSIEQGCERACEPGASREKDCGCEEELREPQGRTEGVHARVLQGEPVKISEKVSGKAGHLQRVEEEKVRGECGVSGASEEEGEGMAGSEPDAQEGSATEEIRHDSAREGRNAGESGRSVCDLQESTKARERISCDRSLPHDRRRKRNTLLSLQYGDREVHGLAGIIDSCRKLPVEPWLIWCDLNDEQDMLEDAFGDLAFSVRGSNTTEEKEQQIADWLELKRPVMISKASIIGWGLNLQHCKNMAFVGITDSYETYYQAVRRCWRFGQARPVDVHIFASKAEGAVLSNIKRKEAESAEMAEQLSAETHDAVVANVLGLARETNIYNAAHRVSRPSWLGA